MSLVTFGYLLAFAAAAVGWWRWRRELRERRLKALAGARRGLTLHEFVWQMSSNGVEPVIATTVYLVLRQRAQLDDHHLHPNDALTAYFDENDDITEFARELMLILDRAQTNLDAANLAANWHTVGDVAMHFSGGSHRSLRTVQ